jgi:hypothetical protein
MPVPTVHPAKQQHGAAMVEFAVAALPLLFCALFVVEAARWHMTRQMLNLALLEAARAGSVAHARPMVMERAFERALLPLFEPAGRHASAQARMRAAFLDIARQTGVLAWNLDVLSPSAAAYTDFGDPGLRVAGAPGLAAIRNDYQAEQHDRRRRMGWASGRGPRSGTTIFEANTLRLRLRYIHAPLVPGLRALLRQVAAMHGAHDPAARAGMLVIAMEVTMPMQSHPVHWQVRSQPSRRAVGDPLLKRQTRIADGNISGAPGVVDAYGAGASKREAAANPDTPDTADQLQTASGNGPVDENEAVACGVVLCCVGGASGGKRIFKPAVRGQRDTAGLQRIVLTGSPR